MSCSEESLAKTAGDEVAESVASTTHGRRLELSLLVANGSGHTATEKDDSARRHHPSGNGIKPECML